MNIVFFGTSEFAIPSLEALIDNGFVPVAVVTSPDKPSGRGKKMKVSPVKKFLQEPDNSTSLHTSLTVKGGVEREKLIILQPEKLDSNFLHHLSNLKPDVGIIASYGKILPKILLELFPRSILNVHPSLLPKYRGPSPIQTTILNDDKKIGVTIMLVDEKMDHGPILAQTEFGPTDINRIWNFQELHDFLAKKGAKLLVETLSKWINDEITPKAQDESKATYTKILKKENGLIDWSKPVEYIERIIRAYNPWPGSYAEIKNKKLKIKKAKIINGELKIFTVQLEGKKEMTYEEFLRGHKDFEIKA